MGISERKDREKAEMRKIILNAAMELFIKEGYSGVSIRKIAEKIEYSPGSIYTYFTDKDSIFYELHVEGFNKLYQKQLASQGINDPRERLMAHAKAYLDFAFENQQYYDIMFIMMGPVETICKNEDLDWTHGQRSYDLLKRNVTECKAAGAFKDKDVEAVAFLLWSIVHGIASILIRRGSAMKNINIQDSQKIIDGALETMSILLN
jgi:AcrR family transcriptional regulator